ncbi:phage tail sheath family protein [Enterobacter ludwigii]|uniref:phage tail sheath family protein n=1 Tax=Enterobacter ludwigii TaxID=299767 RepID=UPI003F719014
MPNLTTTFPGVYIEEDTSPAMSVSQGATAVPLFIGKTATFGRNDKSITRVSNWLDFCQKFKSNDSDTKESDIALQLYFQNGGGACYIYPVDGVSDIYFPTIDEVGDITLLIVLENEESQYRRDVTAALGTWLLENNKGYFLLVDSAWGERSDNLPNISHIAMYYPPLIPVSAPDSTVSASVVMAGVYCRTDRERGVWKAPANVVLDGVSDVSVRVTDDAQGTMNEQGVNVIRYFSDRGVTVWGARTLAILPGDENWRYISVRRLFDAAERDIQKAMRPMVFEPNNALTWKRVKIAIENYLHGIWQQGGLVGNNAEEAYCVQIGKDLTMTDDDISQGKMIVRVGMAAVRPAEFIILQFTQDMSR